MEEILTPELTYENVFEEQVFQEVPWSINALPECRHEVELIQLEG